MFKNLIRKAGLLACLLTLLTATSCLKEDFSEMEVDGWSPEVAIPLVNSTLDMYDIVGDSSDVIVVDPDSKLLALVYKGIPFSFGADKMLQIPDQQASHTFNLTPSQVTGFETNKTFYHADNSYFYFTAEEGEEIDSMTLKEGILNIAITSTFRHSGFIKISFPGMRKDGLPLTIEIPINYNNNLPVTINTSRDISGYSVNLTGTGASFNTLITNYVLELVHSGNPTTTMDEAEIIMDMKGLEFKTIFGDFKMQTVDLDRDSIELELFNSVNTGYFRLVNPKFKMYITNSFGFPMDINIQNLESVNKESGQVTPISLDGFQNPFAVNYPPISRVGDSATTYKEINSSNSSISDLIVPTPKYVRYKVKAVSNPQGLPDRTNFITDKSRFYVDSELEMPLEGYAHGFKFVDTVDFDLDDLDGVESLLLRVNIDNGFPIDLGVQMYFTDSNYNVLDSLTATDFIALSGAINDKGEVIAKTKRITDFNFTKERIPNLERAKYGILHARAQSFEGPKGTVVKIFEYYTLDLKLGIKAKIRADELDL